MVKPCPPGCECVDCLDIPGLALLNCTPPCECGICCCNSPLIEPRHG